MDQDELEDEVFTKTIVTHLTLVSRFAVGCLDWQSIINKRETCCALAVTLAVILWLIHSSRNKFGFFWSAVPMAGLAGFESAACDCEEQLDYAAVFALRGRRSTMEDRFVLIKIQPEMGGGAPVVMHAVLDGHGGEYAVNYVRKYLIDNLVRKIKLLKVLTHSSSNKSAEKVRLIEKIGKTQISKNVLEYIGVTISDYKILTSFSSSSTSTSNGTEKENPEENGVNSNGKKDEIKPVTIGANLVLSSRVKPLEELPVTTSPECSEKSDEKVEKVQSSMYDNMLSPYNNVPNAKEKQRRNSKSPGAKPKEDEQSGEKELTDYLNSKGEILYSDLIKDEIAKVDQLLVKDSKKEGQVGGTCLLMTILDGRTLWVANVGDSRGVLCNSRGDTIPLSYDHKPCQLKEKKRIQEAGGFVSMNGVWRVQGVLATSRALGDYPLKTEGRKVVVSEPDILSFKLSSEPHLRPEFAVLATDGLWDIFSNEEAVAFIRRHLISFGGSKSEVVAAKTLAKEAYSKGSTDNVTVLIVNFKKMFSSGQT